MILARLGFIAQLAPPEKIALQDEHQVVTYAELVPRIRQVAAFLQAANGKVVALYADNSVDWVLVDLACQVANCVCLPVPLFFSDEQIRHCLTRANVDLLLADNKRVAGIVDNLQETLAVPLPSLQAWRCKPPQVNIDAMPKGTQKITFTSGSTGEPKGVCLSTAHQWQVAESLADVIPVGVSKHLCLLPLATLLENIAGVYTPLLSCSTVVLSRAKSRGLAGSSGLDLPRLLACIKAMQPASLILVPQMLLALVAACEQGWQPPASLSFVAVGGANVAPQLLAQAQACGLPVYEGYGLSECGSVVALNTPSHQQEGRVGKVLAHCQVSIKAGQIYVSGSCHLGYLHEPESWYPTQIATGDMGDCDEADFVRVNGRISNLLITSFGRNINPEWIESVLMAKPLLTHCVVVGDNLPALCVLVSAAENISDKRIQQALDAANQTLPDYAKIAHFLRVPASDWHHLYTANGRPIRRRIKARYMADVSTHFDNSEAVIKQRKL